MLKITLPPNEKPKTTSVFPFPTNPHTPQVSVLPDETSPNKWGEVALKRHEIIQQLVKACPFKVGDEVKCYTLATQEMHGKDIVINKIVTSYAQIRQEKWPDNDEPMIIHAYSRDKDMTFVCTAGYLIFKTQKEAE